MRDPLAVGGINHVVPPQLLDIACLGALVGLWKQHASEQQVLLGSPGHFVGLIS